MIKINNIRNVSIIAHIDHGKSTLADRFIQICGGLSEREMTQQILDSMALERERGITIKARNVTLTYQSQSGVLYKLNFIDTPGHVDFNYEVSRSLSACEGALLVVDATQGVEAQSVSNCHIAIEQGLEVIPVLNKIDLPQSDPNKVKQEIESMIGIDAMNSVLCSAKTGKGVIDVLEHVIRLIPPPNGDINKPLQALIIDSWFDNYFGIVSLIRLKHGVVKKGDKILIKNTRKIYNVNNIGIFTPKYIETPYLQAGEVGCIIAGIKDIQNSPVGDTITFARTPNVKALSGFKHIKPTVYASFFPVNANEFHKFSDAVKKLSLNDYSLNYTLEKSHSLGLGFRCGFLGLLHMEVIQERLEREYNLNIITTTPSVIFEIILKKNNNILYVDNPSKLPPSNSIKEIREPICCATILLPKNYLGNIINLCIEKRGIQKSIEFINNQVKLVYYIPMNELIFDFFDSIKSNSKGYASLDYHFYNYKKSELKCIDVLINGEKIDALSLILHSSNILYKSRTLVEKLKNIIPRHMFDIIIQISVDNNIIARSTVKALKKNVLAKCYGGDISRKRKLLEKQKAGKKRMKQIGSVEIPQAAFLAMLTIDSTPK